MKKFYEKFANIFHSNNSQNLVYVPTEENFAGERKVFL